MEPYLIHYLKILLPSLAMITEIRPTRMEKVVRPTHSRSILPKVVKEDFSASAVLITNIMATTANTARRANMIIKANKANMIKITASILITITAMYANAIQVWQKQ
jgi:hypothetical protein